MIIQIIYRVLIPVSKITFDQMKKKKTNEFDVIAYEWFHEKLKHYFLKIDLFRFEFYDWIMIGYGVESLEFSIRNSTNEHKISGICFLLLEIPHSYSNFDWK